MPPEKALVRRKVRSGCLTCKARKVKCDELKPVCNRCRSTGRTCDGYGIWGGGGNGYAERHHSLKPQATTIKAPSAACTETQELATLQWFEHHVVRNISGFFTTGFWTRLVMPAAWTEPAVLHAVMALSSAHKSISCRQDCIPSQQQRFTLQQYNLAIQHLQALLATPSKFSAAVVLITCLLFTSLEYIRGQYKVAGSHLENGLKLLRDIYSVVAIPVFGVDLVKHSMKHSIDRAVFQSFATFHVQADLFGNHIPQAAILLQPMAIEMPSPTFRNVEEARDSLEKLLHGIILIRQKVGPLHDPVALKKAQKPALALLRTWRATYEATVGWSIAHLKHERLAYMLLLSYHAMASIMCNALTRKSEVCYESNTVDFTSIIEHSIEIWKHCSSNSGVNGLETTCDMGWIPPLYYTALKCRVHRIRLHAVRLLESATRREGVWDSMLTAKIAAKVVQLEERGMRSDTIIGDDFALDEVPCSRTFHVVLPESDLFGEVEVDLHEENKVTITCRRYQDHDVVHCMFDGAEWHDTEPV